MEQMSMLQGHCSAECYALFTVMLTPLLTTLPIAQAPIPRQSKTCFICGFIIKKKKLYTPKTPVTVTAQAEQQAAVDRIEKIYHGVTDIPAAMGAISFMKPLIRLDTPDHGFHVFPESTADFIHVFPTNLSQEIIDHEHGLDPSFAVLPRKHKITGIWFVLATRERVMWAVKHCFKKSKSISVLSGLLVPEHHAASKLILGTAARNGLYCCQTSLPLSGMKMVKIC
jgi:hypothetical protein